MLTLCCVCGKVLKEGNDARPSHGYCIPCMRDLLTSEGFSEEEVNEVIRKAEAREANVEKIGCKKYGGLVIFLEAVEYYDQDTVCVSCPHYSSCKAEREEQEVNHGKQI